MQTNYFIAILMLLNMMSNVYANSKTRVNETGGVPMGIAVDLNRDGIINFDLVQPRVDKDGGIVDAASASDKTHPKLPFRFWVNNDLDVVNVGGRLNFLEGSCAGKNPVYDPNDDEYEQTCEVWDEDPKQLGKTITNTSSGFVFRIENYRDLEDFSPINIKIDTTVDTKKYEWQLRAVGVDINLFKRYHVESDILPAHGYIFDAERTKEQFNVANGSGSGTGVGHFTVLQAGKTKKLIQSDLDRFFLDDANGVGHFIFEGMTTSSTTCSTDATNCYIELTLVNKETNEPLEGVVSQLHLDMHDIKDYYELVNAGASAQVTSGNTYVIDDQYAEGGRTAFHASYNNDPIKTVRTKVLDIYTNLFPQQQLTQDYVLQIHGWRMLDAEKTAFSETSYKRLYWSGYKGQMGALHWPTGWFDKPAYAYGFSVLSYVLGNERNYDVSEVVARRVGLNLPVWLQVKKQTGINIHAVPHSMGNVVISEALKNGAGIYLSSYTASQAAVDAGSYDSNRADVSHRLQNTALATCPFDTALETPVGPEDAWRCYNIDSLPDQPFDMPPDMYRRNLVVDNGNGNIVVRHGQTTEANMGPYPIPTSNQGHYYAGISSGVRIINLYNTQDNALRAWEFNQLTKPDFAQGDTWNYTNDYLVAWNTYNTCNPEFEACIPPPDPSLQYDSIFLRDGDVVPYNAENVFDILSYVIPARTNALGQRSVSGEIDDDPGELTGFTTSNQDHSAQFHGYYSEQTVEQGGKQQRAAYWNALIDDGLNLDVDNKNYTGLRNNISN